MKDDDTISKNSNLGYEPDTHDYDKELGEMEQTRTPGVFGRVIDSFRPVYIPPPDNSLTRQERAILGPCNVPLKQVLKPRHLQMIAIGGSIGAGLFISSGNSLKNGGPAGMLIGYFLIGMMLFSTMTGLGEMAVRFPVNGVFSAYTSRFLDQSWGFAIGWLYGFQWLMTMAIELTAAAVTIGFWDGDNNGATNVNKAAWVSLFWATVAFINIFGVRGYGEAEVIFSVIKVIAIIGFIIFGIVIAAGGGPTHEYLGGTYWHNPGAFSHGFKGVCNVFVSAAFAFCGTELCGLAAAETSNPQVSIPRAVKQVFWRVLLFYLVSIVVLGCVCPYDDPALGTSHNGSASPFVIAMRRAGVKALPSIFNVVILLAVLSVANSAVYGSTRTLVSLAAQGHAPKIFMWIDRNGRPVFALIVALAFGLIGFVSANPNYSEAFSWLSNINGIGGLVMWISINLCHIRFRMAMRAQNLTNADLEYVAPGGIPGSVVGATIGIVALGLQVWTALFPIGKSASAYNFFETWLGFIIVMALFIGHKLYFRDAIVPPSDIDIYTGARLGNPEQMRQLVAEERAAIAARGFFYRAYKFWC